MHHRAWIPAALLIASALLGPVNASPDRDDLEARIGRLQLALDERAAAGDWAGALEKIREAASLDPDHPRPYLQLILVQRRRQKLEDAPRLMDEMNLRSVPGRAYANGLLQFMQGRRDAAAGAFQEALGEYITIDHPAGEAACHTALGNVNRGSGQLDDAASHYETALALLERAHDLLGQADVHSNLAKLERAKGHPERAAMRQRQVLRIREELGDRSGQSRSWHEIGVSLLEAGDATGALEALDHALEMRRSDGDRLAEAATQGVRGEAYRGSGDDARSVECFVAAAGLYQELGRPHERAESLALAGAGLRRLGEFGRAGETLDTALAIAADLKQARLQAAILTELTAARAARWEMTGALRAGERALELHTALKDDRGRLTDTSNLGAIHFMLGDNDRARARIETALTLAEDLSDEPARARALNNLGVLETQSGEWPSAERHLQAAADVWARLEDARGLAAAQANQAEVLARMHRPDEAKTRIAGALATYRSLFDRAGLASVLNQQAGLERLDGHADRAASLHREALEIAMSAGMAEEEWRARIGLALALGQMGRHGEALEQALKALDRVEDVRTSLPGDTFKVRFLAGRVELYETAIAIALAAGGDTAATTLEIAERARARGLLDLLGESLAGLRRGVPADLLNAEREALDRLQAATAHLMSAGTDATLADARRDRARGEEQLESVRVRMRTDAPRYAGLAYPQPADATQLRSTLGPDELLLEYFIGAEHAWMWRITREEVLLRDLGPPSRIGEAVARFLELTASPAGALSGAGMRASEDLARLILPTQLPATAKRLLLVPDGPLLNLPFEALRAEGGLLVESREIAEIPSATTLRLLRNAPASTGPSTLLAAGDPVGGEEGVTRLPFAGEELRGIADLFEASQVTRLTGAQLTREALQRMDLSRFRFIHFATHGLVGDDPGKNGLWLGAGPDGALELLTLDDVLSMRLRADLVVLSACRTIAGETVPGEGLMGLARAFLYAGSRGVVVSLWNVGDESSVDFMRSFYSGLVAGAEPATALRRAKLSFLESDRPARRQAYRWAPFILVGGSVR